MVILRFINLAKKERWQRAVCREVYKYGAGLFIFICRRKGAKTQVLKIEVIEVGSQEMHKIEQEY